MATAYLGLGSNLGNKKKNLFNAVQCLKQIPQVSVKKVSRFYCTKPMYMVNQPDFLNAVVKIKTAVEPEDLLVAVKTIEKTLGRRSRIRYGPRIVDIDVLLYGRKCMKTAWLTIPHKRMHERPFVLKPLRDIAPNAIHPVLKKRIRNLL